MNSEKVLKKLFSRQSKSIKLYLGSNPSIKKVKYLFYRPFAKTPSYSDGVFTSSLLLLHYYLFTFHSSLTKLVDR